MNKYDVIVAGRPGEWIVFDVAAGYGPGYWPSKRVAYCYDKATAHRIADMMNSAPRFDEVAWQGCLDHANRQTTEARKEVNRLRELATKQLAERIQVGDDYRHLLNRANTQRDNAEAALAAVRRIVNKTTDVN